MNILHEFQSAMRTWIYRTAFKWKWKRSKHPEKKGKCFANKEIGKKGNGNTKRALNLLTHRKTHLISAARNPNNVSRFIDAFQYIFYFLTMKCLLIGKSKLNHRREIERAKNQQQPITTHTKRKKKMNGKSDSRCVCYCIKRTCESLVRTTNERNIFPPLQLLCCNVIDMNAKIRKLRMRCETMAKCCACHKNRIDSPTFLSAYTDKKVLQATMINICKKKVK